MTFIILPAGDFPGKVARINDEDIGIVLATNQEPTRVRQNWIDSLKKQAFETNFRTSSENGSRGKSEDPID